MENHPFYGENFTSIWLKHLTKTSDFFSFKFIGPVKFVKSRFSLFYYNVGKNITNGTFYKLFEKENDYKGNTFMIYDVLSNKQVEEHPRKSNLKIKKVTQYKGSISSLKNFNTFDDYLCNQFSSKRRSNLRTYVKRLETNFNIHFKVFYGVMSRKEYDTIFEKLLDLIEKRFNELGLDNDILNLKDYYYDLFYKMVLDKEASINVIYHEKEPISICVSFLSSKHLYFAITTFDTDFRRYSLGHVLIYKIMEWCFENDRNTFDFSKGVGAYKDKWVNSTYDFENHILYDGKSLKSIIVGNYLYYYFVFKQRLRDLNVNKLYSKIKFYFRKKIIRIKNEIIIQKLSEKDINISECNVELVSLINYNKIKPIVYDLLYSEPQPVTNINLYKFRDREEFIIMGKAIICKVHFKPL